MHKPKYIQPPSDTGLVTPTQRELTIEDITNNLSKPYQNEFLDLENVYDFLNTVTVSKGKSGFVNIRKPETRKRSYEPIRDDFLLKEISTSPKSQKQKSSIASPVLASTQASSKATLRKTGRFKLGSIEESKKAKTKKGVSNKSLMSSPKNLKKSEIGIKKKEKGLVFVQDYEKIRNLSPYVAMMKSYDRLPILGTLKKGKSEIKLKLLRKKSKDKFGKKG